jgi:type III secretory pathway component EscV
LLLEVASDLAKTLGLTASTQTPTNARFQKTLLPKLRESLFFSRGIRIPPIHLEESPQLRSGHFACWIEGTLVGSAEIPMDRLLVGVAPQELRIFQIEARKTHHPLSMRDASWVATEHKDRLKEAAVPIWQAEEVLTLHLTAILERHAERFLGIQALRAALDILAHHEPTLITQTLSRYPLDILRRVLLLLAEDRLSFCNLRRILESLLEVPQDTDEIEGIADTTRRIMRRYLCQAFSVQETQLLAYALEPDLEALLRYLFLGDALPEDVLPPTSIAPIQALYDALLRRFRALPSSASIPLLLVRDHALRRPLQRVLQRAFPYCGVLSWQEIDPDYDVMIVETLERDALDFQTNKDAT